MNILHLGIICGAFTIAVFTTHAVLAQIPDSIQFIPPITMTESLTARLGENTTGIYYPMYSLSELPQVLAAKEAFPMVPFNVNINPASGPGTAPSAAWASAIVQLKNIGIVVTGYVPTGYGNRTVADVEDMVSAYQQFYPNMLDGIMFDEISGSTSQFAYYQTISNYTRSIGFSYIRANPGSPIDQADVPLFDHIAIYESSSYPDESTLQSRTFYPQYSKDKVGFGATIHSQPAYNSTWLHMATKYLKWVYITDQTEPNPYTVFPSYFDRYLIDLTLDVAPTSGKVAGEGKIGNDIGFTIDVRSDRDISMTRGNLEYHDKSANIKLHSDNASFLSIGTTMTQATFVATGTLDNGTDNDKLSSNANRHYTFIASVVDPDKTKVHDQFSITITNSSGNVVYQNSGTVKGHIEISKFVDRDDKPGSGIWPDRNCNQDHDDRNDMPK